MSSLPIPDRGSHKETQYDIGAVNFEVLDELKTLVLVGKGNTSILKFSIELSTL